jgi:hypothetical protein
MNISTVGSTAASDTGVVNGRPPVGAVLVGAVCGFAWAAGLRGMMAQVAGDDSSVSWDLTFGWLLLPGAIVGGLLGWAEHRRVKGLAAGRRWFIATPLIFAAVLFSDPTDPGGPLKDGVGGGAIALPVFGMLGGYALAGRGRHWTRYLAAVVPLSPIVIWALVATDVGGTEMALDTPRGAWVAVYFYSFVAVLVFACAIPYRLSARRDAQP